MFITSFVSGQWESNCYVVAADEHAGTPCVIVDPGDGAAAGVRQVIEQSGLSPAAILLTHGHLDHVGSAAEVAQEYRIQTWIHPADRQMLSDPASAFGPEWAPMVQAMIGGDRLDEPWLINEMDDGAELDLADISFRIRHAPGHTPGCVLTLCDYPDDERVSQIMFSGDVLFAGSVGRTDLPGGDLQQMHRSLEEQVMTLDGTVVALPGHGPQTSIAQEKANNPYLQPTFWRNQS